MKKRFSIYHLLITVLIFSMFSPMTSVFAVPSNGDGDGDGPVGSLTIHKFEQEPGDHENPDGDGSSGQTASGTAVEGVEYTLIQTHSYDPTTDKWTPVTETTPTIRSTNGEGKIVIDPINLGRYSVQETGWPDHIVPDETVYYVDIPMTNEEGTDVNYNVHIYPKNETIRGGAILTKYVNDSEETLDGATFKVFHKNGDAVKDKDGNDIVLTSTDGVVEIDGLAYGKYYFQEITTVDGYLLNGAEVSFEVSSQGEVVNVSLQNYSKPEVEKEVSEPAVNRGDTVTYTITVDLPGDIAEYDSFVITDTLHANLEYVDGSQSGADGFNFAQNGQELTWTADFDEISPGTVTITFDAVISEDAEANESIDNEVTIDYNNGWEENSDKDNVEVLVHAGSLTVIKRDGDNHEKTLSGAEFELRDENGELVASGTSNANGVVVFDNPVNELPYGNYTLTETKAPEGYNLLRNPFEIMIGEGDNHDITINVDNYKSGWELPKTGGIGTTLFTAIGVMLMAAAFYLYARRRKEVA